MRTDIGRSDIARLGRVVVGRLVAGLVFLAAAMMLLASAAAQARVVPPSLDQSTSLILQARAAMGGGGGHHSAGHGKHMAARSPTSSTGFASAATVARTNRIARRSFATDGNVTNGPNVTSSRDINDRRAVLMNDGRVIVLNDRVVNDQRAVVLNGTSGVLIRFHGD